MYARLAQLVEQSLYTRKVGGSSPSARTLGRSLWARHALVVQWIERSSSKALMQVRFLPGAQKKITAMGQ